RGQKRPVIADRANQFAQILRSLLSGSDAMSKSVAELQSEVAAPRAQLTEASKAAARDIQDGHWFRSQPAEPIAIQSAGKPFEAADAEFLVFEETDIRQTAIIWCTVSELRWFRRSLVSRRTIRASTAADRQLGARSLPTRRRGLGTPN